MVGPFDNNNIITTDDKYFIALEHHSLQYLSHHDPAALA